MNSAKLLLPASCRCPTRRQSMSPKMLNNWQPSSRQRRACSTSRDNVPHALPAFFVAAATRFKRLDALRVQEIARHAQRDRQIGRPDEQPVDAFGRRDLVDDLHRFGRFDLNRHPAVAVGSWPRASPCRSSPNCRSRRCRRRSRDCPTGGYLAHCNRLLHLLQRADLGDHHAAAASFHRPHDRGVIGRRHAGERIQPGRAAGDQHQSPARRAESPHAPGRSRRRGNCPTSAEHLHDLRGLTKPVKCIVRNNFAGREPLFNDAGHVRTI